MESLSLRIFYIKRIKRILPAVISSLIFTIPFAFILLPPKELYLYLSSFQSTLFFTPIFFQNLDFTTHHQLNTFRYYICGACRLKSNSTFCSLMVLFVIYKVFKKNLLTILFSVTFISIILNLLDFGNVIFYQLHFRIWEFLFGVLYMLFENRIKLGVLFKHLVYYLSFLHLLSLMME